MTSPSSGGNKSDPLRRSSRRAPQTTLQTLPGATGSMVPPPGSRSTATTALTDLVSSLFQNDASEAARGGAGLLEPYPRPPPCATTATGGTERSGHDDHPMTRSRRLADILDEAIAISNEFVRLADEGRHPEGGDSNNEDNQEKQ